MFFQAESHGSRKGADGGPYNLIPRWPGHLITAKGTVEEQFPHWPPGATLWRENIQFGKTRQ